MHVSAYLPLIYMRSLYYLYPKAAYIIFRKLNYAKFMQSRISRTGTCEGAQEAVERTHKTHLGLHPARRRYRRSAPPPVALGP
jgi:hypothetical protein